MRSPAAVRSSAPSRRSSAAREACGPGRMRTTAPSTGQSTLALMRRSETTSRAVPSTSPAASGSPTRPRTSVLALSMKRSLSMPPAIARYERAPCPVCGSESDRPWRGRASSRASAGLAADPGQHGGPRDGDAHGSQRGQRQGRARSARAAARRGRCRRARWRGAPRAHPPGPTAPCRSGPPCDGRRRRRGRAARPRPRAAPAARARPAAAAARPARAARSPSSGSSRTVSPGAIRNGCSRHGS